MYICGECDKAVDDIDIGMSSLRWFSKKPIKYTIDERQVCKKCFLKEKKRKRRIFILDQRLDPPIMEEQKVFHEPQEYIYRDE